MSFDFADIGEYEIIEGYTDRTYEIGDTVHFFKRHVDTLAMIEIKDLNDNVVFSNYHVSSKQPALILGKTD